MAYTLDYGINLGSSKTGLTLNAQIIDSVGADTGAAITTGFVEIGTGSYLLHCTTIPDDHRGGIKVYESGAPSTILAFGSINPEEAEYVESGGACNYPPSAPALPLAIEEDSLEVATTDELIRAGVTEPALDLGVTEPIVRIGVSEDDPDLDVTC